MLGQCIFKEREWNGYIYVNDWWSPLSNKYIGTCICCWILRSTTLTFVMISYGNVRPSRWPATDVFRLKMHWAEAQSCYASASYFHDARQNFLLCTLWLKMRITLTVRHVTHWPPCKWQPEEKATQKFFTEQIFFSASFAGDTGLSPTLSRPNLHTWVTINSFMCLLQCRLFFLPR